MSVVILTEYGEQNFAPCKFFQLRLLTLLSARDGTHLQKLSQRNIFAFVAFFLPVV